VEVKFTPREHDLDEIEAHLQPASGIPVGGGRWACIVVGGVALFLFCHWLLPPDLGWRIGVDPSLLVALMYVALWLLPGFLRHRARSSWRRQAEKGPVVVRLEPAGLKVSNAGTDVLVPWDRVCFIQQTPALVLFVLAGRAYHYVPTRAFADEQAFSEFMGLVRVYRHEPRPEKAPVLAPPSALADSLKTNPIQDRLP
jgi:hypothetical protein